MAFTEASLVAQLDPAGSSKTIQIIRYIVDTSVTHVYAIPVYGFRGHSGWYDLTNSNTAAQAATQLQTALL
jgi:hypothetical protein